MLSLRASTVFLSIGLSLASAQASPVAIQSLSQDETIRAVDTLDESAIALTIESAPISLADWERAMPVGRGIISRKSKTVLNLFCLERNEQGTCVRGQYGISDTSGTVKRDALGNTMGAFKPVGPVLAVETAAQMRDSIRVISDGKWKQPKLGFALTKKAWNDSESGWHEMFLTGDGGPIMVIAGGAAFGGLAAGLALSTPWTIAIVAGGATFGFVGPTVIDLVADSGKALLIPFVAIQRGVTSLFSPNYEKIADAMTSRNVEAWQIRPMTVSEKAFEKTLKTISGGQL